MPDVLLEKTDGVALITLNRPDSLNALGGAMFPELAAALADCELDRDIRCVALTGAGRAFCAGGDVKAMLQRAGPTDVPEGMDLSESATLDYSVAKLRQYQEGTSLKLHTMLKPTVALVNGHAAGGGLSLALACDVRICSELARFGTSFRNVALSGDFGSSFLLPRIVGSGRARELFFTAEVVDAQRALEIGIANHVYPHDEFMSKGMEFCRQLAQGPSNAYARMKENLNFAETANLQQLLYQEAANQRLGYWSLDTMEALRAFSEKRPPRFVGE